VRRLLLLIPILLGLSVVMIVFVHLLPGDPAGRSDRGSGSKVPPSGALPADRIDIAFSHRPALGSSARAAEITGYGSAAAQVVRLRELRQFLAEANYADARRQRMPGDASTRSYARLVRDDGSVILMNSPRRPDGPAIYHGKSYSAAVHLAEDVKPFVAIAGGHHQRPNVFHVPETPHAALPESIGLAVRRRALDHHSGETVVIDVRRARL